MIKKTLNFFLFGMILFSSISVVSGVTINETLVNEILENDVNYNQKNLMWGCFLIVMFLFWWFILKHIPPYEISSTNYIKSMTLIVLHGLCWSWIIYLFYLFGSSLFISRSEEFIQNKLFMISLAKLISLVLVLFIAILNGMKYFYKLSGAKDIWEKVKYEVFNDE